MMLENTKLKVILLVLSVCSCALGQSYLPNWESINSRPLPAWYDQSKFGIFIHWGVYSVPAFAVPAAPGAEWYWYNLEFNTDNGSTRAYHDDSFGADFTYQTFAPMFKANLFDPQQWANLFVASGAKYVVLTSKHHEGFTLWPNSQAWGWNSVDIGPGKDLVGLVSKYVKQAGLHMGLYHSLYEWFNPLYDMNNATTPPVSDSYVTQVLLPQLYDVVNSYEPEVGMYQTFIPKTIITILTFFISYQSKVWADGDWEQNSTYWKSTDFLAWLYTNSSVKDTVVTNDRWGSDCGGKNGGYWTPSDRYNPGTSWGYNQNEALDQYQNTTSLIQTLVSTVSCGGNLLLDVGPTAEGVIPMLMQERLIQIGEWLSTNGEAIYNTTFWRVQNDTIDENIWYTTNAHTGAVYAMSFYWPTNSILTLEAPIVQRTTTIELLGYGESLSYSTANGQKSGLNIKLPFLTPGQYPPHGVYTFKLSNVL
ncbi:hypothetical protein PPL_02299 [Heterostelium album PN500]|uniref:alpha-L-fucosidase n=1 Tax=Heterostelium pallidum (strain ATCC 26659 / Pp 5 / PN500) TaxID=670386 RepID=D3B1X4_HETP5|nr:hypothetical protein PPL_02299 [Heterostelium album PN500]EFA85298.1 hypothetical protein PPL_02299 [Heterostelium album PN500]|eukprot:XP_020437407.1 hypothetical protein PPL_02299 [Heterostelium album PN500]